MRKTAMAALLAGSIVASPALGGGPGLTLPKYGLDSLVSIVPPSGYGEICLCYDTDRDGEPDLVEMRKYDVGSYSVSKPFHVWYDSNRDGRISSTECMDLDDSLGGGQ